MSDWSKPTLTSNYSDFVAEVKGRDDDLAKQFDGTTSPNVPTGTIKWNSSNRRHEKWNGSAWSELVAKATTAYAIRVEIANDADRLAGQLPSYYTDIPSRLGYTPFNTAGGTLSGAVQLAGIDLPAVVQHSGTGHQWRGRIVVKNAAADIAHFIGNYNGRGGVFGHSNALDGWAPLYLNTLGQYGHGLVYLPSTTFAFNNNSDTAYQILHAGNFNSYAPTLGGSGASGTWGINVTGSSSSAPVLSSLGTYSWSASTLPTSFAEGVTTSFVRPDDGWPNYGTVITARTYPGGGGTLQMYVPYGPSNGGNAVQVRFGNYSNNGGNSWTEWKSLLASDGGVVTGNIQVIGGRLQVKSDAGGSASWIDMFDDESPNGKKYLHANGNLIGFVGGDGTWKQYTNESGQVWAQNYGWLHDCFFSSVGNCIREGFGAGNAGNCSPGESSVINCYGSGNMMGYQRELVDNGGQIAVRSVRYYYNCNCNCDCTCY